jgi:Protein of unknown function (DUF732)
MTTKVTKRSTRLPGFVRSKAFERALIVAAVAAVLVAFGAWFAMGRPTQADAAAATSSPSASASDGTSATPSATPTEAPAATTAPETAAPEGEASEEADAPAPSTAAAPAEEAAPQAFLDQVTDSGLAPPVDDAQKLAMARDVCEEMSHGSTSEDMIRALTFAGATDEEAANFVQLAVTNICPEYA